MKDSLKNKLLALYEEYGEITIACRGNESLPIDKIVDFQGDLKKLSEKNLLKLCKSIFINNFCAPFFVFNLDHGVTYQIGDGHGRLKALLAIREAGIPIPAFFPTVEISAENEADARKKLLAITSQYGRFQKQTLDEWIAEIDPDIAETFALVDGDIKLAIASIDAEDEPEKENPIISDSDVVILTVKGLTRSEASDLMVDFLSKGYSVEVK